MLNDILLLSDGRFADINTALTEALAQHMGRFTVNCGTYHGGDMDIVLESGMYWRRKNLYNQIYILVGVFDIISFDDMDTMFPTYKLGSALVDYTINRLKVARGRLLNHAPVVVLSDVLGVDFWGRNGEGGEFFGHQIVLNKFVRKLNKEIEKLNTDCDVVDAVVPSMLECLHKPYGNYGTHHKYKEILTDGYYPAQPLRATMVKELTRAIVGNVSALTMAHWMKFKPGALIQDPYGWFMNGPVRDILPKRLPGK